MPAIFPPHSPVSPPPLLSLPDPPTLPFHSEKRRPP